MKNKTGQKRSLKVGVLQNTDPYAILDVSMAPLLVRVEPLFAYGLLQPGESLYEFLKPFVIGYRADAWVSGYRMYASSYPWAVPGKPEETIWGSVLLLKESELILPKIDIIEMGYTRLLEVVSTSRGNIQAWMYVYHGNPGGEYVEGGDFVSWRRAQGA